MATNGKLPLTVSVRAIFTEDVIAADLDRLAALQQEDGGWIVEHASAPPAGALDWRGHATVRAIGVLRRNGREAASDSAPLP